MGFKALSELSKSAQDRSYLLKRPYCHFATNCFMLTKQSINPFIDNRDINALHPLVFFARSLTTGQQSIISIGRWDEPTVTKVYLVAMEMVKKDREAENGKLEVQATQIQFEKILSTIFDNPKQAQRYADAGRHYSASLKRKYDIMKQESSNTPLETTAPVELPRDFDGASCSTNSKNKKLVHLSIPGNRITMVE